MVYRKGELNSGRIDRDWPHQVALPETSVVGKNITIMERFCHGLNCVLAASTSGETTSNT